MQLTNITITKTFIATTAYAAYQIEYTIANNTLTKVSTNIRNLVVNNEDYIGYINYENGNITSNFISTYIVTDYFTDFEKFMQEIQEIEAKKE